MALLNDVAHIWGNDLQLSPTGDLLLSSGADRSKQRVLRRLLTNSGDYLDHTRYGGGIPASVGALLNVPTQRAKITAQMKLERSVAQTPTPPKVTLNAIPSGVSAFISYTALPDSQPVVLSFDVNA